MQLYDKQYDMQYTIYILYIVYGFMVYAINRTARAHLYRYPSLSLSLRTVSKIRKCQVEKCVNKL